LLKQKYVAKLSENQFSFSNYLIVFSKVMKKLYIHNLIFLISLFIYALFSNTCKKENLPTVITSNIIDITQNSAIGGGNIIREGSSSITARGVCWSTLRNPTTLDSKTTDGSGAGNFTSRLTGLSVNTTYYIRAYATNSSGTAFSSNSISFTTNPVNAVTPTLTTAPASSITTTSASCGGNITNDGGSPVTISGICWSTSQNPTTINSKTADGSVSGNFTSKLTGLTANTLYYVRAYATNSAGSAYGSNQVSFVTLSIADNPVTVTDIDGNIYKTVIIGTQVWMSENLKVTRYGDGTPIPNVSNADRWTELTTGAYCNFNNEISNADIYGCMYNFYSVADSRKLCPTGWHVPTDSEWSVLETYLGNSGPTPGGSLKESGTSHWISPNAYADNSSGFSALPGGYRDNSNGRYYYLGIDGYWWTGSEYNTLSAFCRKLFYYDGAVYRTTYSKDDAFSVRCVKDY
jgi:uncharacterized protein (TIGR02145 family)